MQIRLFTNIDDPCLEKEWKRLDKESKTFPQMTYDWCRTWWKFFGNGKNLHIVMLLNEDGHTIAIAPLCIKKILFIKVLHSIPYEFGDFYQFITSKTADEHIILNKLINYFETYHSWSWVRLELLRETNPLSQILIDNGYKNKTVTSCVLIDVTGLSWDQYLKKLKSDHRKYIKKFTRKLNAEFDVDFRQIKSEKEFNLIWPKMRTIYLNRISKSQSTRSIKYEEALKEAMFRQFALGNCLIFLLYFDGNLAAFNYGFSQNNIFYAWQSSLNIKYKRFHASIMNVIFSLKHLINNNFNLINLMAGLYNWKLDLSYDKKTENLLILTSPSNNIKSALLNFYFHFLRDKIKEIYHWMISFRLGKLIKRLRERRKLVSK